MSSLHFSIFFFLAANGEIDSGSEPELEVEVEKTGADLNVGTNFLFGDGELEDQGLGQADLTGDGFDWRFTTLPYEGVQVRKGCLYMLFSLPFFSYDVFLCFDLFFYPPCSIER